MTVTTARARSARITAVTACAGLAVFTSACTFSLGSTPIAKASDVAAGDCLTIDGSSGPGRIDASTSNCDNAEKLTFYAAETVGADGSCSGSNSAYITFRKADEKLCITPNFVAANCYQIPTTGGNLVDYRKVHCDAPAADKTVVATLESRGAEDISCTEEQTKWKFSRPTSIGYCLKEVVA
ncbi:pyridine nucleotide-disulfide oxidoreductase [Gordonia sp. X0973]|uniref:pyridine nucleotide-disulfide oxidoreductase n=1 Tax=Gordonia sp. X0973 TaxID=2742602 RepID=UPI000F53661F|nr:pyridine nucleotide-disulfide oxidoreductase [Gordonia sp. X0973]QKT07106.1 pyridine nucleotide-disulfide oxidoreductase [Gordonia sp. X0973]